MLRWAVHRSLPARWKAALHSRILCVALKLKPLRSEVLAACRRILLHRQARLGSAAHSFRRLQLGWAAAWQLRSEGILIKQRIASPTAVLTALPLLLGCTLGI